MLDRITHKRSLYATLMVAAALSVSCHSAEPTGRDAEVAKDRPITAPPAELGLDPFYTKHLDCDGIPVICSDKVDDRAMHRACELLNRVLANRPDVRASMVSERVRYVIIAEEEQVTDIPAYRHMKPKAFWNERARGFGGRMTSCGEENLLDLPTDRYEGESIFVHELAHAIHSRGLNKIDPTFQPKLDRLYRNAMDKGLYRNDYASTNATEYWAEAVQAFFDCDRENNWNHNSVNTRRELYAYDPGVAELVRETFRITDDNDWRYKPVVAQRQVLATPASVGADTKYTRYMWCRGLTLLGEQGVSDAKMRRADDVIRQMFRYRHDILKAMIDQGLSVAIQDGNGAQENQKWYADLVDAAGGSLKPNALAAPRRLTTDERDLARRGRKPGGGRLVRDLAIAMYLYTGFREHDPSYNDRENVQQYELGLERIDVRFSQRVTALYNAAMRERLWRGTDADTNPIEYYAAGVRAYFDAGDVTLPDGTRVRTREQLAGYDPALGEFVGSIFKHGERNDWRLSD